MCRDGDEACVVDHEQVITTLVEWFAFKVAVDVVFYFAATHRICSIGSAWRYLINRVANSVQPVFRLSVGRCGEGKEDGRKRNKPSEIYGCSPSIRSSTTGVSSTDASSFVTT